MSVEYTLREIDQIIGLVDQQPRLQEFVYHLFTGNGYELNNLRSMDSDNLEVAMQILLDIYPNNVFGDIERFN